MRVIEKRNFEFQLTPTEARELENVINLLDDLHRTNYFDYFRDDTAGSECVFHIDSFKDFANLLDYLLDDATINVLA